MSKIDTQKQDDLPATRKDVEEIVTSVVAEALKGVEARLEPIEDDLVDIKSDLVDVKFDINSLQAKATDLSLGQARIESKLDTTISQIDTLGLTVKRHDRELRSLHPKIA